MSDKETSSLHYILLLAIALLLLLLLVEPIAMFDTDIINAWPKFIVDIIKNAIPHFTTITVFYFGLYGALLVVSNNPRRISTSIQLSISVVVSVICITALVYSSDLYAMATNKLIAVVGWGICFVYPHLALKRIYDHFRFFNIVKNNEVLFGLNRLKDPKYPISLKTTEGPLPIRNPFQGIWVFGGPGSGKSASVIDPILFQFIMQGFAGVVYDFKGTPLTQTVYDCIQHLKKNNPKRVKIPSFAMINFTHPELSSRINILSPKYIDSSIMAKSVATTLANSVEKKWIKDRDFWANNAIAILHAAIWNFAKNYPHMCTLPHVVAAITSPLDQFITWLNQDEEIKRLMRPIADAIDMEATGQVAGALSSIQLPMNNLLNPEIFWAFSGDEVDPTLNDPENPAWLCVCNDTIKAKALDPGISLVLSFLSVWLNKPNMAPLLFAVDELPTVYIADLQNLPATGRSNRIATLVGLQVFSQLEGRVGKDEATMIKGSMLNQWWGNTTDREAADLSKAIGQIERTKIETSIGQSTTYNQRMERVDAIKSRDIMTQPAGHFVGKIANGDPAWFNHQFQMLDKYTKLKKHPFEEKYPDRDYIDSLITANYESIMAEVTNMLKAVS